MAYSNLIWFFQRIFGDLTSLITGSQNNGTLQPTVGVSFGLPTYGPGYGGYAQNPISSDSFVNPYYTAQQGLGVGPVNVNPLFSFQTGTDSNGELALRPLVNLHLTPNGCSLLGCDKSYEDAAGSFPHSMLKAIMDPFKLFGGGSDAAHGISADYTAPKPSYGAPDYSYGAPPQDYSAPKPSYGAPEYNYPLPQLDYSAPKPSYGPPPPPQYPDYGAVVTTPQRIPQTEYTAPKPAYNPPQATYNPPQAAYKPPQAVYDGKSPSIGGQTHVHHHYYHQQDLLLPEDQYGREDNAASIQRNFTDVGNNYLAAGGADSEVFKRHTVPDSAGFLPVNLPSGQLSSSSSPSSSSTGFKFPRARSLETADEKKSSAGTTTEELIEPRHSGGDRKRRRRSPDGIGHHHAVGGAGHHDSHQHLHQLQAATPSITVDTVR
jgi:hypothetical protein